MILLIWNFKNRLKMNKYFYPKNQHTYTVIKEVRMKVPENGTWIDAVLYEDNNGTYVREKNDFYKKFIKLEN